MHNFLFNIQSEDAWGGNRREEGKKVLKKDPVNKANYENQCNFLFKLKQPVTKLLLSHINIRLYVLEI